jgi:hypothetical protein
MNMIRDIVLVHRREEEMLGTTPILSVVLGRGLVLLPVLTTTHVVLQYGDGHVRPDESMVRLSREDALLRDEVLTLTSLLP